MHWFDEDGMLMTCCRPNENTNKWVRVEDVLPPLDKEVLVFSHGQMSICSLIRPDHETADLVWEDAYGFWDDDEGISAVTHWMFLPEPPKEDA